MIKKRKIIGMNYLTFVCDNCGSEDFSQASEFFLSYPPIWKISCKKCGVSFTIQEEFPRIEYIFEGENDG